ncbi:hypothetical protein [Psychromonas sp. Urea-02u-13]|uniref:hypothetical protein n=1 Tax=Psychromonas sp. Urea-02u-13 TaxID=2058326 RepID=UPI000C33A269|nr:hypothetical protein [Psychromonas sp. Urea-02u-13]PKG39143.1 hypothetical protein CXF74_09560 [Psychromonas sp. Urea-02u-13]
MTIEHLTYIGLIGSCFMASRLVDGITKQRLILLVSFLIVGAIGLPSFIEERQQHQLIQKQKETAEALLWKPFNECIERRKEQINEDTQDNQPEVCISPAELKIKRLLSEQ